VMVQYDDDHSFALKPIPGVLIAAGYVASPDDGGGMVEEEGAQGSRGDRKWRQGSGTGEGGGPVEETEGNTRRGAGSNNMS
jgi:hypothetical protein